ncbi:hypothetical protein [Flavobacterium orientale]|nr:hypothetical protein [Flavobacterium orientale]
MSKKSAKISVGEATSVIRVPIFTRIKKILKYFTKTIEINTFAPNL